MRAPARTVAAALLLAAAGCLPPNPVYRSGPVVTRLVTGFEQRGTASFYGPGFDGRPTASGEVFDMDAMTCAHRTLPFGTILSVENLDNGRETTVRVNDRGPYVGGRIIDLSRGAAERLGMLESGTAEVMLRVVGVEDGE